MFELHENGVNQIYEFVFPFNNSLDTTIYSKKDHEEYYNYLKENPNKIFGIGNPLLHKDYLLLFIARLHDPRWIAYNLVTHDVLGLDHIVPDQANDFMEFFDVNHIFSSGDYLFFFLYPQQVRNAKNKSLDERHIMRKEYSDLEKHNNPILVRFKLK